MGRLNLVILPFLVTCFLSCQLTDAFWRTVGKTWSWVAIHDEDHVPVHLSGRRQQEIDTNRLRIVSNINGIHADVSVSMRFKNLNEERLYQKFTIRIGDKAMVSDFRVDHMGIKVSARAMSMTRTERLVDRLRESTSTASGVVMLRTTPYVREYDVYVFMSGRSSMTFELTYKEKLEALLSEDLYEQIISVYPYQLVEDFQADVTINRPSSGAIGDVTAFWDSFSVSSTIADPWGLQREPLSIRSWDDGHRINLHPLSNEMQLPRSWQSDLIVFFRWDSREGWGLGSSSWSSDVSESDEFMGSEFLSSYEAPTLSTASPRHTTVLPSVVDPPSTTPGETEGSGSIEENGSGNIVEDSVDYSYDNSLSSFIQDSSSHLSDGSITYDSSSSSQDSSSLSYGSSSSYDSSFDYSSDFHFENETVVVSNTNEESPYIKIYQKETAIKFKLPTFGGQDQLSQSKLVKIFKSVLRKLFQRDQWSEMNDESNKG